MLWQSMRLTSIFVNFNLLKSSGHTAHSTHAYPAQMSIFAKNSIYIESKANLKLRDKKTTKRQ